MNTLSPTAIAAVVILWHLCLWALIVAISHRESQNGPEPQEQQSAYKTELGNARLVESTVDEKSEDSELICNDCGASNDGEFDFCWDCASRL